MSADVAAATASISNTVPTATVSAPRRVASAESTREPNPYPLPLMTGTGSVPVTRCVTVTTDCWWDRHRAASTRRTKLIAAIVLY